MTTQQLYFFGRLYLVILAVVAVLTRATPRRIAGALLGGAVVGVALLGIVAIGEKAGWWHMVITWEPYFLTLMCIVTIPGGFIFLITWRIARRFGGRLAVVAFVAAVLGPARDYRYMATFPEWGAYAPGLAPVFAISVAYVILGILGHGTMRLVAGPAEQTGWRAGHGNRPDAPSFENGTPEPHFADCARMTSNPEIEVQPCPTASTGFHSGVRRAVPPSHVMCPSKKASPSSIRRLPSSGTKRRATQKAAYVPMHIIR
jgi:hypothetical protein